MKRWQLVKYSTNEILEEHDQLPEDWGPIFGLKGFIDKIHNLEWVGYPDNGWIEVDIPTPTLSLSEASQEIKQRIDDMLRDTSEYVAADNTKMSKGERVAWIEYRSKLREIPYQSGFPYEIEWPKPPTVQD